MVTAGIGWGTKSKNEAPTCGEGFDRADLNLPGLQQELIEAVVATGTPTIVVLVNGRPYSISWVAEHVPTILEAWYAGEEGGNALADIIFGRVSPSGRLPVSIPRAVGQIPVCYNHKPSARGYYNCPGGPGRPGRDYVFMEPTPLFAFGHGLSYTTFKYTNLRVSPTRTGRAGRVDVSVDVCNTGQCDSREVVQLYINDLVSSVTTPIKVLRGFRNIYLKPGQAQKVEFYLTGEDLSLLNEQMEWVVEPGIFEVMIGGLTKQLEVR